MRRFIHRARIIAACVLLSGTLAACESFDPMTLTDWIPDGKKKLQGDRKEVFPSGVPGVTQGVPQEMVKGNQPPADAAAMAAPEPAPPPEKPKPKPKPKTAAAPRPRVTVAPADQQGQPNAPQTQQGASPWPASPNAQQQPQAAWPAPAPAR